MWQGKKANWEKLSIAIFSESHAVLNAQDCAQANLMLVRDCICSLNELQSNTSFDTKSCTILKEWKRWWDCLNKLNHGIWRSKHFCDTARQKINTTIKKESETWWQHTSGQSQVKEFGKEYCLHSQLDRSIHRFCQTKAETSQRVLCKYDALARARFQTLSLESSQAERYMPEHLKRSSIRQS